MGGLRCDLLSGLAGAWKRIGFAKQRSGSGNDATRTKGRIGGTCRRRPCAYIDASGSNSDREGVLARLMCSVCYSRPAPPFRKHIMVSIVMPQTEARNLLSTGLTTEDSKHKMDALTFVEPVGAERAGAAGRGARAGARGV